MPVSVDEARKVAALARLRFDDDELARHARDLDAIVRYVELLKDVDVDGVAPMFHPTDVASPRRADVPAAVAGVRAIAGSAGADDGLVRVPKILD